MRTQTIGVILAVSLLFPSVADTHEANLVIARRITPAWSVATFLLITLPMTALFGGDTLMNIMGTALIIPPGLGHIYSCDWGGFIACAFPWLIGMSITSSATTEIVAYIGCTIAIGALVFDSLHTPIAAKRHNERHAKEKAESSRVKAFPTLAISPRGDYFGAGIGVWF